MSEARYACRLCICLQGLHQSQVRDLPSSIAQVEQHARETHSYPSRDAFTILVEGGRNRSQASVAAALIERMGVAIEVGAFE